MKTVFYYLENPYSDEHYHVYGRSEWQGQFGLAEWSEHLRSEGIVCPLDAGHRRSGRRRMDPTIILPSPTIGDFVWTWYSECIVTDRTLSLFREAGFTGFEVRPVTVEKVKRMGRKRSGKMAIPSLWELVITGQGRDADPESGIRVIEKCEGCGLVKYSSFRNGIIVDENHWDGSDFFTIKGYPLYFLVTESVKDLIVAHQLTNCGLVPSHELQWRSGIRWEERLDEIRSLGQKDLASLLEDLNSDDPEKLSKTMNAIAEKRDPSAADSLIEMFCQPGRFTPHLAAIAVARIGSNKEIPEQTRMQIFSKIGSLIGHDDPWVRDKAATALGYIGGSRAGAEVM